MRCWETPGEGRHCPQHPSEPTGILRLYEAISLYARKHELGAVFPSGLVTWTSVLFYYEFNLWLVRPGLAKPPVNSITLIKWIKQDSRAPLHSCRPGLQC